LDEFRNTYRDIDTILSDIAMDDQVRIRSLPRNVMREYSLVYLPQIGFLAKLPATEGTTPSQPIPGFDFKFKTEHDVYYKNATALDLDDRFGDLQGIITDTEMSIVRLVQDYIMQLADTIREISKRLAEMDCYIALAHAAILNNLVRPVMTSEPVLLISQGRHLLRSKTIAEPFVANSTVLGPDRHEWMRQHQEADGSESMIGAGGRIQIITGPNNSGKTVYIKQVGIIAYLAHTGSFVPASQATIGVCDQILTRIQSVESVNSNFSTFTYDTSQMSYMLRHCTQNSLCLIDEVRR